MSKRLSPRSEPGLRATAINPMGYVGTKDDLNSLATFLLSSSCDWLRGLTLS